MYFAKGTHFTGNVPRQEFVAKVIYPTMKEDVFTAFYSKHYEDIFKERQRLQEENTAASAPDRQKQNRESLRVNCEDNNPIYSEDKYYVACLINNEYVVGRKLSAVVKTSDTNYYQFYEKTGSFTHDKIEYIAYADYQGMFEDAGFYGNDLDQIYSRIIEINPEKQTLKVVADPFMFSEYLMSMWFLSRSTPQFTFPTAQNNDYRLSPSGKYLVAEVVSCTGCQTIADEVIVDISNKYIITIGKAYFDEKTTMKWLDNNTLEWYEGKMIETRDVEHSFLGSGLVFTNMGRRTKTFE